MNITGTSISRVMLINYNKAIVHSRARYGSRMEEPGFA